MSSSILNNARIRDTFANSAPVMGIQLIDNLKKFIDSDELSSVGANDVVVREFNALVIVVGDAVDAMNLIISQYPSIPDDDPEADNKRTDILVACDNLLKVVVNAVQKMLEFSLRAPNMKQRQLIARLSLELSGFYSVAIDWDSMNDAVENTPEISQRGWASKKDMR